MKKYISILLLLALLAAILPGCGSESKTDGLSIVTTVFPIYDWVRQVKGDGEGVTMLLDSGVDMHSYQPTADDLVTIYTCDLFIYVGGESDEWVADALAGATNSNMTVLNLMDILGDAVLEEEDLEGTEQEEHDHEHEHENDEHIWLSLGNADAVCRALTQALCDLDPSNAESYAANCSAYTAQLSDLDSRYAAAVENAAFDTLVFADRFPFRYLCEDYGIGYYAAFSGCSAETEASFETIVFLADKLNELGLTSVVVIDGSDASIAGTVTSTAGREIQVLTLNSMQSVTPADIANGATYLSIMAENLAVLEQALN